LFVISEVDQASCDALTSVILERTSAGPENEPDPADYLASSWCAETRSPRGGSTPDRRLPSSAFVSAVVDTGRMISVMDKSIVVATASRQGTREHNADAAAGFSSADGRTAAVVVDGIGNSPTVAAIASVLAQVATRVGAQRGALAGMLSAAALIADPGAGPEAEPAAVAVLAVAEPGGATAIAWVGDCRASGWDGAELRRYSTDHTVGQQLRINGTPLELATEHDNWVRSTLASAVVATVYEVEIAAGELVVLTSDGVHDQLPHAELTALVDRHAHDPVVLADAIVAAVREDAESYRDDATAAVLRAEHQ
jgi:PPM family protein phosphatase